MIIQIIFPPKLYDVGGKPSQKNGCIKMVVVFKIIEIFIYRPILLFNAPSLAFVFVTINALLALSAFTLP